jgi:hypothetical protein
MESLNKLIQVFKLHYEKILLSVMLAGLAAAVWFLYEESIKEEETNARFITGVGRRKVQGVKPVDLSSYQNLLKMVQNPPALSLAGGHNVFNPVKWVRRPDGMVIKVQTGKEVGPEAMTISKITPLHYIISLDRIAQGGYVIGVTREAAERLIERRKQSKFVTQGNTNQFFTLREVKGPPEDPTELVLELADTKETVSIAKTKEYKRVVGYEVDLKYPVENKNFPNQRVGSTITVAGDQYNIVAISENEVVLSARLNDKKYTIRQVAGR